MAQRDGWGKQHEPSYIVITYTFNVWPYPPLSASGGCRRAGVHRFLPGLPLPGSDGGIVYYIFTQGAGSRSAPLRSWSRTARPSSSLPFIPVEC